MILFKIEGGVIGKIGDICPYLCSERRAFNSGKCSFAESCPNLKDHSMYLNHLRIFFSETLSSFLQSRLPITSRLSSMLIVK